MPRAAQAASPSVLTHHIGLRCQGPKALLVLPVLQVEDDAAFIHIGMDKGEAEALLARA